MRRRSFLLLSAGAAAVTATGLVIGSRARKPTSRLPTVVPLQALDDGVEYDVCIIGSGIAAAVVARELTPRGLRVVVLESGFSPTDSGHPGLVQLESFRSDGSLEYPWLQTRLRALGGTTGIWTGNCLRFLPDDFSVGTGVGGQWPFEYSHIDRFYERAEETLFVRGYEGSQFAPPRRNPLPVPFGGGLRHLVRSVFSQERAMTPLEQALEKRGLTTDRYPRSQVSQAEPGPVRALLHYLPALTDEPGITLATGATVTRLLADASGTVIGAEAKGFDQQRKVVRARTYVVAAGAVESARLLQLSRSPDFPNGLGNDNEFVGRHFTESVDITFQTSVPDSLRDSFGSTRLLQYTHARFREGLGGITLAVRLAPDTRMLTIDCGISMAPVAENRWSLADDARDFFGNPLPKLTFALSEQDLEAFERGRKLVAQLCRELGADSPTEQPGMSWGHHHMGTCRMGFDPAGSVVTPDCRLHQSPNCYLAGSGVFASAGAGHPTLLIAALAHRLGEHLAAQLAS